MGFERTAILAAVWLVIVFEFISYNILFVPGFLSSNPTLFWTVYPPFLILVTLLVICYHKSIVVPPGTPSANIVHDDLTQNHSFLDLDEIRTRAKHQQDLKKAIRKKQIPSSDFDEIESLTRISYCFKCQKIKPVRAHHCKVCGVCIERMDHHCPWVGNCVGRNNHKYFIQFLFYSSSALTLLFLTMLIDILTGGAILQQLTQTKRAFAYLTCFSSGALALSIGFLFVTQMLTLRKNLTTLESYVEGIGKVAPWRKSTFRANVEEIAGSSSWLCPTVPFPRRSHYMSVQF